MKKRLTAFVLTILLALGTCTAALGVGIDDGEVLLKQGYRNCTLTSATMMLRRKAILDGDAGWADITTAAVGKVAWSGGLAWNFTYNGVHVTVQRKASGWSNVSLSDKKAYLISMLEAHPEGIVTHDYDYPHAVLLTSYDAETDTFYCCDPASCCPRDIIPLSQCIICGSGQDGKLKHIDQLWYIDAGVSSGAGTMPVEDERARRGEDTVACLASRSIDVDGRSVCFRSYVVSDEAGNETCFIDPWDLAAATSGSAGQFDVGYDEGVLLFTGVAYPYDPFGLDDALLPQSVCAASARVKTRVDGADVDLDTIEVTDLNGESHYFYCLRELGDAVGLQVGWDAQRGAFITAMCS